MIVLIVPTLPRGNAARDAPRHWTRSVPRGIPTQTVRRLDVGTINGEGVGTITSIDGFFATSLRKVAG
ncbi:hypothetical protein EMIT0P2_10487 [Pseudomonas sp. IT-P2]